MVRERAQAVVVQPLFTLGQSGQLAEVLGRRKLPSNSGLRPFALAGGLMTFGPNRAEQWRRSASFVDRLLKVAPASCVAGGGINFVRTGAQFEDGPGYWPHDCAVVAAAGG